MTAPLLALSLSNTLLEIGALAAFAALAGIAVLSLLVFSQARELKRLREWAGRAPERAAELEQRVSADAAARVQRVVQPRAGASGPVPRATPVVTRATVAGEVGAAPGHAPVGQAVGAAVGQPPAAAGQPPAGHAVGAPTGQPVEPPASAAPPGQPVPGQPAFVPTDQPVAGQPGSTPTGQPVAGQPGSVPAGQPVASAGAVEVPGSTEPEQAEAPAESRLAEGAPQAGASPAVPATPAVEDAQAVAAVGGDDEQTGSGDALAAEREERLVPVTASVAASASASAGMVAPGASALTEAVQPPAVGVAPPAGGVAAPATAAARAAGSTGRSPAPPSPAGSVAASRAARPAAPVRPGMTQLERGRSGGLPGGGGSPRPVGARGGGLPGPPFLREEERSAGRTTALIVGGVVFGVAVLVGILLSLGGGSSPSHGTATASHAASTGRHAARSHSTRSGSVASPAETNVVVLNGTETNGLAHRLATNLQQSGYTQSAALDSRPAGRSTSVVEYAEGHRTEAQHVAQSLGIAQVQPLEGAVEPLVGAATVVVIAGADQAALGGEG